MEGLAERHMGAAQDQPLGSRQRAQDEQGFPENQPDDPGPRVVRVDFRDYFEDLVQKLQTVLKFIIRSYWLSGY